MRFWSCKNKIRGSQCCFSVGLTDVHDVTLMFFWLDCFFSLWPAGGVLHFHSDSVCSEDLDKVSMKHDHCLLHLPCSGFEQVLCVILYSSSHFVCPLFLTSLTHHHPNSPSSFTSVFRWKTAQARKGSVFLSSPCWIWTLPLPLLLPLPFVPGSFLLVADHTPITWPRDATRLFATDEGKCLKQRQYTQPWQHLFFIRIPISASKGSCYSSWGPPHKVKYTHMV